MIRSAWLKSFRQWLVGSKRFGSCRRPSRSALAADVRILEHRTLLAAAFTEFVDPHPAPGNQFGTAVVPLSTGNVVITSPLDDAGGTDAGAVYLFNGSTGALISTLTGSSAHDQLGNGGVTALSNGNYVVRSPSWDNGAATNAGAVTWGSGDAGVSGVVSIANSLVGTTATDVVGNEGVTALSNGNYVILSSVWDNGAVNDAGAATWGNGVSGSSGAVSIANSLVGTKINDNVGSGRITTLSNGNYVIRSPAWDNGAATNAGAVTWGNGTTGISGAVSVANSLVGTAASDLVGNGSVTALSNGNYVVDSNNWNNGAATNAGAVTWGNGMTGISGAVSIANSLVGTKTSDAVGSHGVTALSNGNYVIRSVYWANGAATEAGAVTWGNGVNGISGAVSPANSLVGTTTDDRVGDSGLTELSNGNYVVRSPYWNNGAATTAGAVTWVNGATGNSGAVSVANSLVGTTAGDFVGGYGGYGVTALSHGNYVVSSGFWDNGAVIDAGAVTWVNGTTGASGAVSVANSLVGTTASDFVGSVGVTALSNGNYVVSSPSWTNGAATDVGAVTWGNGTSGISGAVSVANSLVGTMTNDLVGSVGVTALGNGNYVVSSPSWSNGAVTDVGAVTWGNGTGSISGAVSVANSLIGTTSNDVVGNGNVTALSNGNYVVRSPTWDNGAAINAGAVTWGNGATGISGAVSIVNSLVGTTTTDAVGLGGVTALNNGNFVVNSDLWDNGALTDAGAVTWGDGVSGISGVVSATNSAVGLTANTGLRPLVVDNPNNNIIGLFPIEGGGVVRVGSQMSGFTNVAPTAVNLAHTTTSLPENTSTATRIKVADITIVDDPLGTNTLSLTGADAASFEIDAGVLYLKAGTALNFETKATYAVTVTVDDTTVGNTPDATVNLTLTITDVNEAPTAVALQNQTTSLAENTSTASAIKVADIVVTDDALGTNTLSLAGTDASSFEIFGTQLRLKTGVVLDFETKAIYAVTVRVDDTTVGNTPDATVNFTLNITDVNEAPTAIVLQNKTSSLAENTSTASRIKVADIVITDDGMGTNILSLTGTDAVKFEVFNGGLYIKAGTRLNYEVQSSYNVTVNVDDATVGNTPDASSVYTLTLTDVAESAKFAEFADPHPSAGNQFGAVVVPLSTGNVVITSPFDDAGGVDAGAVYLLNGSTGALISTITGSHDGDNIGLNGVTVLSNGNFVVMSQQWDNGAAANVGAITFGNGTAGVSGVVSAANSLVGSSVDDGLGLDGITALPNGNYVVVNTRWDNGSGVDAGAVTFGSGATGVKGTISATNSLVGISTGDGLGIAGVTVLTNGNYVVANSLWDNGSVADAGAVTFGSSSAGVKGVISAANSLVGTTINDWIGAEGVTLLPSGNYIVRSASWSDGLTAADAGAVTFGNGSSGVSGAVSASNSLVGSHTDDSVGLNAITILTNGNYVVHNWFWDNGSTIDAGAATFGSGVTGISGAISSANSLIGSHEGDLVGSGGVTALTNGNYVVNSSFWKGNTNVSRGAVTFGNGTAGVHGIVSDLNSLVGDLNSATGDAVGYAGVTALPNGNYVVASPVWHNVGAVTFASGTSGIHGTIDATNSLVGSTGGDGVGIGGTGGSGVVVLPNGNYVVSSILWNNGAALEAGALTFGSSTTGVSGLVSSANSLVGTHSADRIGRDGITILSNSNYVVRSGGWDNDSIIDAGAVTFGSGTSGITGSVGALNSLIGESDSDDVGGVSGGVTALTNGNYVVFSPLWNNGNVTDAGAATFGSGTAGISGTINAVNSLVGSAAMDRVGYDGVTALSTGNYAVRSEFWNDGATIAAGAVTFGNGTVGVSGVVSAANSLVGSTDNDLVGAGGVIEVKNGNFAVISSGWDNGTAGDAGAVTFGNAATGVKGVITAQNSLVGTTSNGMVGSPGVTVFENGNYVVRSASLGFTFGSGTAGVFGPVTAENSALGLTTADDAHLVVDNGNDAFYGRFEFEGSGHVRVGSQPSGFPNLPPIVSLANTTTSLPENLNTSSRVKVAELVVTDEGRGTNTLSLSGADAAFFEIDSGELFIKAGTVLNFEAKTSYAVTVNINDPTVGATPDSSVSFTLNVTNVNEGPFIGGAVASQPVNDNATRAPFSALTVTDPDNQNMLAKVTILNGTVRGDFTAASATGWTRSVTGNNIIYSRFYDAAPNIGSVVQAAVRAFVFQPRTNAIKPNTTELTDITLFVNDGLANATATTRITTTSVNNAPTFGGTNANVAVNDNATVNPFTALTATDVDTQELLISVTILNGLVRGDFTPASTAGWAVRYVLGNNITYKRYFGPQANVGAAAQAAFRALVFQPRSNAINPGTTELTDFQVTVSDGVAPAVLGTGTRVTTTSINNAPTIGGAVAGQTINDNQTKAVFSTLTVTDPDTQGILARVTITGGTTKGDFTSASAVGWTRSVSGTNIIYNRYFNPAVNNGAVVQAAIRGLVFQPRTSVPIATTETTSFTVFVNDGLANVTNSTTSVITTGVAPRVAPASPAIPPLILDSDITTVVLPTHRKNTITRSGQTIRSG